MTNVHRLLPRLAVNRRFIDELMSSEGGCCALGVVEERKQSVALVALRVGEIIPRSITADGFVFGHRLLGGSDFEVLQLTFEFTGFANYHAVLNPASPIVRRVLGMMRASGDYFVLVVDATRVAQAFRSGIDQATLVGLASHWPRIAGSSTSERQYGEAIAAFARQPLPPGRVLDWVCRDDLSLLDLHADRLELRPA